MKQLVASLRDIFARPSEANKNQLALDMVEDATLSNRRTQSVTLIAARPALPRSLASTSAQARTARGPFTTLVSLDHQSSRN
jgi:hypothetical protein